MPQLHQADCLDVLRTLEPASVGLIYLDPPFFTQKRHSLSSRHHTTYSFDDSWEDLASYLQFLRERLLELKRVMTPQGMLFFHCDRTASHHIRLLLDEVFGVEQFLSEIIWAYKRWSNNKKNLLNGHQTIFMYSKTADYTFNPMYEDYSETTNLDQIYQKRERNQHGKTVYARDELGEVIINAPKKGVPLSDVWQIPYLNPKANERTGYPTQKPILLLERIIQLASHVGDIVLDPFCGSGTTLVAAQLLARDYIGIDISAEAIALTESRLAQPIITTSAVLQKGYDAYDNLPDYVKNVLSNLPVRLVQRNAGIDAIHNHQIDGYPVVLRVQRKHENLSEAGWKLAKAGKKMQAHTMILLQIEAENTLFDTVELPPAIKLITATEWQVATIINAVERVIPD